jgi:hypothetical protein
MTEKVSANRYTKIYHEQLRIYVDKFKPHLTTSAVVRRSLAICGTTGMKLFAANTETFQFNICFACAVQGDGLDVKPTKATSTKTVYLCASEYLSEPSASADAVVFSTRRGVSSAEFRFAAATCNVGSPIVCLLRTESYCSSRSEKSINLKCYKLNELEADSVG